MKAQKNEEAHNKTAAAHVRECFDSFDMVCCTASYRHS